VQAEVTVWGRSSLFYARRYYGRCNCDIYLQAI
jgi:hypothetical protein